MGLSVVRLLLQDVILTMIHICGPYFKTRSTYWPIRPLLSAFVHALLTLDDDGPKVFGPMPCPGGSLGDEYPS